ncbi:hypothetical protein GCM10009624_28440 [Gordonia sinesedis]
MVRRAGVWQIGSQAQSEPVNRPDPGGHDMTDAGRPDEPADRVTAAMDAVRDKVTEIGENEKVKEALGTARDKINEFAENEKVQEAVTTARDKVTEFTENEKVQDALQTAKTKLTEAADKLFGTK